MSFLIVIGITVIGVALIVIGSMIYNKFKYGTIWLPEDDLEKKEMAK